MMRTSRSPGRLSSEQTYTFPTLLYGKIFRSTMTHAKIVSLDVSKAEQYLGSGPWSPPRTSPA